MINIAEPTGKAKGNHQTPAPFLKMHIFSLALSAYMSFCSVFPAQVSADTGKKATVAVIDFKAVNLSDTDAAVFTELIRHELISSEKFSLAGPRDLSEGAVLGSANYDILSDSPAAVGGYMDAAYVICGALKYEMGRYTASVICIDRETSGRSVSFTETADNEEDAINKMPGLIGFQIISLYGPAGGKPTREEGVPARKYIHKPEMVLIPAGRFRMGDALDLGIDDERPAHDVYLDAFYISRHEVSFDEYEAYCDATGRKRPNDFDWGRGPRPVIFISWNDAADYCNWLSEYEGLEAAYDGNYIMDIKRNGYRLPTEAEWEKAARGGLRNKIFPWGDTISSFRANYVGGVAKTERIDSYESNGYGVYNMSGNVEEWCGDWYGRDYYSKSPAANPTGPRSGYYRIIRGGYYGSDPRFLSCSARFMYEPLRKTAYIGFRVARKALGTVQESVEKD